MKKAPENLETAKTLPRAAIILGLVSLFSDMSTEMAYPLLPLFFSTYLGAKPAILGLIEGIAEATASVVTGLSGMISDRIGKRKSLTIFGFSTTALAKPVIALAEVWPTAMLGRFLDRFGKGIRSAPKDAILSDVSTRADRGRVFGFERMMDSLGAVLGPLIALLLLYSAHLELRSVLLLTAIPALIAALLVLTVEEPTNVKPFAGFTLGHMPRKFWIFIAVYTLFSLGNSSNAFILLKGSDIKLSETVIVAGYIFYNAVYSGASYPAGVVSDRLGRQNVLAVGCAIYALSYLGFAVAGSLWEFFGLFALYGLYSALTDGVSKAMAVDIGGSETKATAVGIFSAVTGLSKLAASLIAGLLWQQLGSASMFYFGAATAAMAAIAFSIFFPSDRQES